MDRESHHSQSNFTGQHGEDKYIKQGATVLCHFPTSVPVTGRHAISQPRRCNTCHKVRELRGVNPSVLRGAEPLPACFCRAGRTAGLPATPRPVQRAAGCRTGLRTRAGLARPRTAPSAAAPAAPAAAERTHSPGGRASRRPWLCGGSAAQTAAQVSLETPAGADQGQAQPEPPAKSGSGHGRPALCGGKGAEAMGRSALGEAVPARPRRAPAEAPRRGSALPAAVAAGLCSGAVAGQPHRPRQRTALTRCPLPVSPVAPLRAPSAGSAAPPAPAALGIRAQRCRGGGSVSCKPLGNATVLSAFRVKGGPVLSLARPFLPPWVFDSVLKQQHRVSRVTSWLLALSSAPAVLQEFQTAKPGVVSGFTLSPSSK